MLTQDQEPEVTLRRSSRVRKDVCFEEDGVYPDGPPVSAVEKWIAKLDQEAFPAADYARIDDIVVFCLFATKKRLGHYKALKPTRAFMEEDPTPIPVKQAKAICKIWHELGEDASDSPKVAEMAADMILERYAEFFTGDTDKKILKHVLERYHIMKHTAPKTVRVYKLYLVKDAKITCGLRATADFDPCTVILATCSSMSSDIVADRPGVSIIISSARQKVKSGPRLILRAFRFANHDCNPNCQMMPIPNSYAYALCTLRKVATGEALTVNYAKDGSYFGDQACRCATCDPDNMIAWSLLRLPNREPSKVEKFPTPTDSRCSTPETFLLTAFKSSKLQVRYHTKSSYTQWDMQNVYIEYKVEIL